jgi:hypothetical protein
MDLLIRTSMKHVKYALHGVPVGHLLEMYYIGMALGQTNDNVMKLKIAVDFQTFKKARNVALEPWLNSLLDKWSAAQHNSTYERPESELITALLHLLGDSDVRYASVIMKIHEWDEDQQTWTKVAAKLLKKAHEISDVTNHTRGTANALTQAHDTQDSKASKKKKAADKKKAEQAAKKSSPQKAGEDSDNIICRNFLRTGKCRYDEDCKFLHVEVVGNKKLNPDGAINMVATKPPKKGATLDPTTRLGNCYAWMETGKCPRGEECYFRPTHTEELKNSRAAAGSINMVKVSKTSERFDIV